MNKERTKSIYFTEKAYYYILKLVKQSNKTLTFNKAVNQIIEEKLKNS